MELQIFYMTLRESKEILKNEGILLENPIDFSSFLKEIGAKSFQEKTLTFARYDNLEKLIELLKQRKQWPQANFMKESDNFSLMDPHESYIEHGSPLKVSAPAMRRDSLESHEKLASESESNDSTS